MDDMNMTISDGMTLDQHQRVVEQLMAILSSTDGRGIKKLMDYLAPNLQTVLDNGNFAKLRKEIREKFGVPQEIRFVAYERLDQGDRLTYLACYTRKPVMRMVYSFDTEGKVNELAFIPLDIQKMENAE